MADSTYGWRGGPRFPGDAASGIDFQTDPVNPEAPPQLPQSLLPRSPVQPMLPMPLGRGAPQPGPGPRPLQPLPQQMPGTSDAFTNAIEGLRNINQALGNKKDQPPTLPESAQPPSSGAGGPGYAVPALSPSAQPPSSGAGGPGYPSTGGAYMNQPLQSMAPTPSYGGSAAYRAQAEGMLDRIGQIETGNRDDLVGPGGELTRYQIMPSTARDPGYGVAPLKNASLAEARRFAIDLLAKYLEMSNGNEEWAAAMWNGGGSMLQRLRVGDVLPAGVDQYIAKFRGLSADMGNGAVNNPTLPQQPAVRQGVFFVPESEIAPSPSNGAGQAKYDLPRSPMKRGLT